MPVVIVRGYQTKTQQTMPTPASTINSHDRLACAPLLHIPVYTKYICELRLTAETCGDYGCYYYYQEYRMKSLSTYWLLITWWLHWVSLFLIDGFSRQFACPVRKASMCKSSAPLAPGHTFLTFNPSHLTPHIFDRLVDRCVQT